MGLDVTAYQKVRLLTAKPVSEFTEAEIDDESTATLYVLEPFRQHADGLVDGVYAVAGETLRFHAGSYSGYNIWRDQLARMAGYGSARAVWNNPQPGAFVALIHDADNEGMIGPITSAKLARNFADWHEHVPAFAKTIADPYSAEWFVSRFGLWRKAFELAAGEGCVELH